jgi:hypothetical protein
MDAKVVMAVGVAVVSERFGEAGERRIRAAMEQAIYQSLDDGLDLSADATAVHDRMLDARAVAIDALEADALEAEHG